ncbi:unnamed protein product [Owenia fusiformis]|uniref:Globin domain-containing protein n=1 Tax=Owenia fusiformis TaxID=6347 RepID=A0A8J1U5D0_OWEFU|nr:unnamed protein product [Owenia fusiformis]
MGMGCSVSATQLTLMSATHDDVPAGTTITQKRSRESTESGKRIIDERLKISENDRRLIARTWKGISRNMEQTGIDMFLKLFQNNFNLKNLFSEFRGLETAEAMRQSQALENHAMMVMCTLDDAICSLDDVDYVQEQLRNVGKSHRRFHGYVADNFLKIEEPFLESIKETIGAKFTPELEDSYRKTINFVLGNLAHGFSSGGEKERDISETSETAVD